MDNEGIRSSQVGFQISNSWSTPAHRPYVHDVGSPTYKLLLLNFEVVVAQYIYHTHQHSAQQYRQTIQNRDWATIRDQMTL